MSEDFQLKFIMQGCRELLEKDPLAIFFKRQVGALELSMETIPSVAIDYSKSIIETACKTILRERNITLSQGTMNDFKQLVSATVKCLPLIPQNHPEEKRKDGKGKTTASITELIDGFTEAIELASNGLGGIRNSEGTASHGKDAYKPELETFYALFTARSCDAIVHFLFSCHRAYPVVNMTNLSSNEYNSDDPINKLIDEDYETVKVAGNLYKQSEILFRLDQKAYLELVNSYEKQSP